MSKVWPAIKNEPAAPRLDYLRMVRFSDTAFTDGIEGYFIDEVTISVTSVAKTVTDCFKYRNKIGIDVALEALREA